MQVANRKIQKYQGLPTSHLFQPVAIDTTATPAVVEGDGVDDETRCAVAALEPVVLDERTLDRVQVVTVGEALDRGDGRVAQAGRGGEAAEHGVTVDEHRARAAHAAAADELGAGEPEAVAPTSTADSVASTLHRPRLAVDHGGELHATSCCRAGVSTRRCSPTLPPGRLGAMMVSRVPRQASGAPCDEEARPCGSPCWAGGIGGYFGGRLAGAGHQVSFLARGAHLEAIRENGLHVKSVPGDFVVPDACHRRPRQVGPVDRCCSR